MRTFNYSLIFGIIFISFYCHVVIGSPPLEKETSSFSQVSKPSSVVIKKEPGSFTIEEILSPKKYIMRYLETARKEYLPEKSPDQEHPQIIVEKEIPSTDAENVAYPAVSPAGDTTTPVTEEQSLIGEAKGTQTPAMNNASLQAVTGQKSPSPPSVVEEIGVHEDTLVAEDSQSKATEKEISADNLKTDVRSTPTMPGSATTFTAEQQFPAVDESLAQRYLEDNKPIPPLTGEEFLFPAFTEKKGYLEKYLRGEGHRPGASFSETPQETLEGSAPMAIATPEHQSETIAGRESLPVEARGTQTLVKEDKSHQTTDENRSTFTPAEESSYIAKEGSPDVLIKEAKEPEKGISSPEPAAETGKEAEDSKPAWDIWHHDPTHGVILAIAITLIAAKIAEWIARMLRLPAVVGNLIIGMLLGNIFTFTGWDFFHFLRTMPFLKMVSYFGTLLLLFTAGLHTDIRALLKVGASSFLVAIGGIIVPAWLGLIVGHFLLPDASTGTKLLIAILLCNTGMGLLMAVLGELKIINTPEGRILTGAAVITEIIVILTFGLISGFVVRGGTSVPHILVTIGIAISFLAIILVIILRYGEGFGNFLTKRVTEGLNIPIVVISALLLAFMSGSIGLHTVIGAFVAGLLLRNVKLNDSHYMEYGAIERIIRPYYTILVPILFVRVGAQVELESFLNLNAVLLGLAITGAAIIGKMFCSVCPIERRINRTIIGIGMAMKLEGTLILAGIGRDIGILDDVVFSSVIMVIVFTSVLCPSFLKASWVRQKKRLSEKFHVTVDEKTSEIYLRYK
ncbi:MAG: cation:proton antiporter [Candidatus Brocadia sp.]|nr:cation:proton antiporter [Candidatus Brocadia sp.]